METAQLILATVASTLVLTAIGWHRGSARGRLMREGKIDHGFATKALITSLGLSASLITVAYPTGRILYSLSTLNPATTPTPKLEDHLPPGFGIQFILGVMALGVLITVAYSIYSWVDQVNAG